MNDPWHVRLARGAGEAAQAFRAALDSGPMSSRVDVAPAGDWQDPISALLQGKLPQRTGNGLAPYPVIDKYPSVFGGGNLSLDTISAFSRLCTTGYRREYVDMLSEQVEREPHGYAVLAKRIFVVAGARLEITPPEEAAEGEKELAGQISEFCERAVLNLPSLTTEIAQLNWGLYYGANGSEAFYARDADKWIPKHLEFIHSRRISWPNPGNWDAYIWDQGAVSGTAPGMSSPTTRPTFGLRLADYPGKFLLHTPRLRGEYPTREGLGRILCWWFGLKGMTARVAGQYVERFARPWPFFHYSTGADGKPRPATDEDIEAANDAARALGTGSLTAAVLPDSIKCVLAGPGVSSGQATISPETWITFINGEISKCVLGETLTTESGKNGNRAAAEVHKQGSMELARYDARMLADTLVRDLLTPMVALNWPDKIHLAPRLKIVVEEKPDPQSVIDVAAKAVLAGMPVNADGLAKMLGLPLVEVERPDGAGQDWQAQPRRMAPLAPVDFHELDPKDPNEDEDEQGPALSRDDAMDLIKQIHGIVKTKPNGVANGVAHGRPDEASA